MELHPVLEKGEVPIKSRMWYVVSAGGCVPPSMRVGHSALSIPCRHSPEEKILILGGANPSGVFPENHLLNLGAYEWEDTGWKGFKGRYEHAAFVPSTNQDKIFIFGGADQTGNLSDVQMLELGSGTWSDVKVSGEPPCPRTCRGSAWCGSQLFVFSGGEQGADPVADARLHVFDAVSCTWKQPPTRGTAPKPRHGHAMVAVGSKLYLHGGMARETFYDDLHEYDIESLTWKQVTCNGESLPGMAAHGAVAHGQKIVIFGGMTPEGASHSTYVLDTDTFVWKRVELNGPPPASRLDHAMCVLVMPHQRAPSVKQSSTTGNRDIKTGIVDITGDAMFVVDGVQRKEPDSDEQSPESSQGDTNATNPESSKQNPGEGEISQSERTDCQPNGDSHAGTVTCIFIHGGMDTGGQIFDDSLVMRLDDL